VNYLLIVMCFVMGLFCIHQIPTTLQELWVYKKVYTRKRSPIMWFVAWALTIGYSVIMLALAVFFAVCMVMQILYPENL
jgi:hypothetical protein